MPGDVLRLRVRVRLLAERLHGGHLPPGLRHLDAVRGEHRHAADGHEMPREHPHRRARPQFGELWEVDGGRVEHPEQRVVEHRLEAEDPHEARHAVEVLADGERGQRREEPEERPAPGERRAQLFDTLAPDAPGHRVTSSSSPLPSRRGRGP